MIDVNAYSEASNKEPITDLVGKAFKFELGALSIMKNELTEMQHFALATINNYHTGVSANMVAYLWYKSKGINLSAASRRRFGATVAGYNACRALVKKGKATSTPADYGEIFFPIKQTGNV